jgi:hypothetical protein
VNEKPTVTEPLGLVLAPNQLGQYPDGAAAAAVGIVHRAAGNHESAPAFEVFATVNAGATVLRAVVILTSGHTLVLLKLAAGWRHCWVNASNVASPVEAATCAYGPIAFEVDGTTDFSLSNGRVFVTSDKGPVVFDYLEPANATERTCRLAGMFAPAVSGNTVNGAGRAAIGAGQQAHLVACVLRHWPDCYEIIGPPSAALQVFSQGTITGNIQVTVWQRPGHPQILIGDEIHIYRTIQVRGPVNNGTPEEYDQGISNEPNYYLASVYHVTTDETSYTWEIATGDQNLGTALYTNVGAVGATSQKRPPPIARVIEQYNEQTFYLNITEPAARITNVGAGIGEQTDAYSLAWGIGGSDALNVNGVTHAIPEANALAYLTACNVDCISRVNPDTPGVFTTPGRQGFAFRFDYAAAGNLLLKASHGDRYQPPLPLIAEAAEVVEPTARANGMAWSDVGQPEASIGAGVVGTGELYAAIATSNAFTIFSSLGIHQLTGTSERNWSINLIDSQAVLLGAEACCRLADTVFAHTSNGLVSVDAGGQVQELSTSALGESLPSTPAKLAADHGHGDIYIHTGGRHAWVYASRWNKWSHVELVPDGAGTVTALTSSPERGFVVATFNGSNVQLRRQSATNYQRSIYRTQPLMFGDVTRLKRWIEVEWLFRGDAAGGSVTLICNRLQDITRTLREHNESTSTYLQAGIEPEIQGVPAQFTFAQTSMQVPRDAPAISNTLSVGYVSPAGTRKYTFCGVSVTRMAYGNTRKERK